MVRHSFGSPKSDCQTKIIAKRRQAAMSSRNRDGRAKYRVTFSLKNLNCRLDEVWKHLKNEMGKLQWFDPELLEDSVIPKRLAEDIESKGISHALNGLEKTDRQKALDQLSLYPADPISITKGQYQAEFDWCFGFLRNKPKVA